jgi:hypothetical protein
MGSNRGKKPKIRPVLSKKPPVLSIILGLLPSKGKKEKSSKPAWLRFHGVPEKSADFLGRGGTAA